MKSGLYSSKYTFSQHQFLWCFWQGKCAEERMISSTWHKRYKKNVLLFTKPADNKKKKNSLVWFCIKEAFKGFLVNKFITCGSLNGVLLLCKYIRVWILSKALAFKVVFFVFFTLYAVKRKGKNCKHAFCVKMVYECMESRTYTEPILTLFGCFLQIRLNWKIPLTVNLSNVWKWLLQRHHIHFMA